MPVRIRLARRGAKKRPFYRIVVADSRRARDGKYIEKIGTYNPMLQKDNPERVKLDVEKAKEWIAKGAQPSDRVTLFLSNLGVVEKPIITEKTKKHLPRKKTQEKLAAAAKKAKEIFLKNGFTLAYPDDRGKPLGDGFYFTIQRGDLTSGELLYYLLQFGLAGIPLDITGSKKKGVRICISLVHQNQYPELDNRVKALNKFLTNLNK